MASPTHIVWFRQDLRLADQPALHAAVEAGAKDGTRIAPVYVLDDTRHPWPMGGASKWWLHHSLHSLAQSLKKAGAPLILRRGNPAHILPELAETLGAETIHAGHAHEPAWRAADAAIAKTLAKSGRKLALHRTSTLIDPDRIRSQTGTIYGMYTPFARTVEAQGEPPDPLPAPTKLRPAQATPSDRLEDWHLLPTHPDWAGGLRELWRPGEQNALARLHRFTTSAVAAYATGRNLPGEDGTSMLSPHLHFGELSPRTVWHASRTGDDSPDHHTYRREIIWRDFSAYLLWHHPTLPDAPLRPAFARLAFLHDSRTLAAWQRGRTGVPIVDAGMRQLWQTGWMHNRVRMIAASFLVKHLLTDWRAGAAWFWDTLVDADLASNSASWQWIAGTGIDSQPFFRVFNPVSQGQKFDADGAYVRRFVPEIAALPDRYLHAPLDRPAAALADARITLGRTYPAPIVDLAAARARALDTYRRTVRDQARRVNVLTQPAALGAPISSGAIPAGRPLRIVGDVHGDTRAFAFAADTDRFVIQLGDLIDFGPDSAGALRLMFRLIDEARGIFLVGNHDRKLGRALRGERVRGGPQLEATLAALDAPLRDRTLHEIARAPAWILTERRFFVHAAFHTGMLANPPPDPLGPVDPLLSRALFGETTGRTQQDGFPERLLRWVNHIPPGMTVYVGHDQRSRDGRPWVAHGDNGGAAIFLDTGAGKGGHLSWIDLDPI